jgi:HSP20 family protein
MVRNPMTPFRSGGMSQRGFGDPFLSLHREMNRLFDDVFNDRLGRLQPQDPSRMVA